jgi:periplasmic divalent cation tolerance protein
VTVGEGASGDAELRVVLCNAPPEQARAIARALVERRLAACVNLVPGVVSIYRWKGAIEEGSETTLLIKTRASLVGSLTEAIRELHPYDVPEVVALPIVLGEGSEAYARWVVEETVETT